MSKSVVFLGAGASKALGLPLTNEILPRIIERLMGWSQEQISLFGGDPTDQGNLKRCLMAILPGLDEILADKRQECLPHLPLITDVFSVVDYLLLSGDAPERNFALAELSNARVLLERAVFELLVRSESPETLKMRDVPDVVSKEWRRTSELQLLPRRPPEYETRHRTVDWIKALAPTDRDFVTLISTNYDIEIEQQLYARLGYHPVFYQVDFGMSVRDPDTGKVWRRAEIAKFGNYKLHGSLNWLRCSLCGNVYLNPIGPNAYLSFLLGEGIEKMPEELQDEGANECHCGYRPLRHVIVAPSFVREVRDPMLLGIWQSALQALREAETWYIIGYSLPPEDVAIRTMLLRAYQGRDTADPPKVVVVQKGEKESQVTRYRLLFPEHTYVAGGLEAFLKEAAQ
jgi:hypothetical protein